jgi:hypothetical protein
MDASTTTQVGSVEYPYLALREVIPHALFGQIMPVKTG